MNESGAVVTAELPGVELDKVDISVLNDTVTIAGSREAESQEEKKITIGRNGPRENLRERSDYPLRSAKRK
jgi:HSP20 family molecular chaperone IbpA